MLTGSHNPPEYNGIKMVINDHTLAGDEIQDLYECCIKGEFALGQGEVRSQDITHLYQQRLQEKIKLERPLKIVVDCGNGIVGGIAPNCYRALGCEVIELYCDVDGNFPNHHPDPSEEKKSR